MAKKLLKPAKYDGGKLRYDLLPWESVDEVVKVLNYGAAKYSPNNWRGGFEWGRVFAAATRHLKAWWLGEDLDPESGLHHLAHCSCDILFLLSYVLWKKGSDDRPIKEKKA